MFDEGEDNELLDTGKADDTRCRWDDDVVFKNQARGTEDKRKKEFVNVRYSAAELLPCTAGLIEEPRICCVRTFTSVSWYVRHLRLVPGAQLMSRTEQICPVTMVYSGDTMLQAFKVDCMHSEAGSLVFELKHA